MLRRMRTTLVLDDRLLRLARRRAVERGLTLSDLVNEALRSVLTMPSAKPAIRFRMVTFGERSPMSRHEPSDFANALEEEDRKAREP